MAGNILLEYIASTAFTVTNLHSLASSQTWIGGWTSAGVDNGTNEYEDYIISGQFTTHASNRQVGQIRVYAYGNYGDTAFSATNPDIFATGTEGTEGAATITNTQMRDAAMVPLWRTAVASTASQIYVMRPVSLRTAFGGLTPDWWAIWITQNCASGTNAGFAASGSKVAYVPVHRRYT